MEGLHLAYMYNKEWLKTQSKGGELIDTKVFYNLEENFA